MPAIFTYVLLSIPLIGAYAIFALGISVIYGASRVLNLAHGAMAMFAAYLGYSASRAGVPVALVALVAVGAGALLGILIERVFIRRLQAQGPTGQTVGTVAVTGLLIALAAKIWGTTPLVAPAVFPDGVVRVGASGIRTGEIGLFVTAVAVSALVFAFLNFTGAGLAMRAAADNRRAASLVGIDPDLAAAGAWALGGGLAALAGVLLAGVTNLDPYNLSLQVLPAFVAVLIGGLDNPARSLLGAVIAGLSFGLVPYFSGTPGIGPIARLSGAPQLALTLLALVVMAIRGRRLTTAGSTKTTLVSVERPRPARSRGMPVPAALLVLGLLLLWPWVVPFSVLGNTLLAVELSLAAISIVVLTGWVGQISLAQGTFVGVAALVTGLVVRKVGIGFPLNFLVAAAAAALAAAVLGVVALRVRGLYLAVATLIFSWMGDQFLLKSPWLGAGSGSSTIGAQRLGDPEGLPFFDLTSRRTLYYVMAAVLGFVVLILANLRDTRAGRALFAVRGSEAAAASLGIDVVRAKLLAFTLSGALAGVAGNLVMLDQRTVVPSQFFFTVSLQFLAIAVVGGLSSLGGAIAAGALFAGLNELFFRVSALSGWLEVVSAGLLALVLLAYPAGLAGAFSALTRAGAPRFKRLGQQAVRLRNAISRPLASRSVAGGQDGSPARSSRPIPLILIRTRLVVLLSSLARSAGGALARVRPALPARTQAGGSNGAARRGDWLGKVLPTSNPKPRQERQRDVGDRESYSAIELLPAPPVQAPSSRALLAPMIEAQDITVQFGGLRAVDGVSLEVREGQIVGLIGPNGAGKTTILNALLGLNQLSGGRVLIGERDVTRLAPHLRARLGIARTFQVLELFPELTVFDNLLVATHVQTRSGPLSGFAATSRILEEEARARRRVRAVLRFLSLESLAGEGVRGLPFGVLRMVELGRALVTGARVLMLDEPASGLNEGETERLANILRQVRAYGVSFLLIEHDVRMVVGVSDYVYVVDQGRLIAEGAPADVRRDPSVVRAYLGQSLNDEGQSPGVPLLEGPPS